MDAVFYFMVITVNGETFETSASTLKELLEQLGIQQEKVAIEANLSIIKKADYSTFKLKEGDSIEVVHFVGGG